MEPSTTGSEGNHAVMSIKIFFFYVYHFVFKVYENDASRIPKNQLTRLGWILPSVDMESLDKFRMNDSDVLAALGAADFKISMEKVVLWKPK